MNFLSKSTNLANAGSKTQIKNHERQLVARWVDSFAELIALIPEWNELAENACWRNPSFESNFLIPALENLANDNVQILVVENVSSVSYDKKLFGLIPVEKKRLFRLPLNAVEVWKHEQCFDSTPLIRNEAGEQVLASVLEFLRDEKFGLLSLNTVSGEKQFDELIKTVTEESGCPLFEKNRYVRAAFRPDASCEEYLKSNCSKNARKGFRRQFRRLTELGNFEVCFSDEQSDFAKLTEDFLRIESSGWKGRNGTALASNPSTKQFYEQLIARSAAAGKARFLTLSLDGNPIAMLSDIQSGKTVYSYKTAFNEKFSDYSPGVLAEIKNLESLHRDGIELADSCTASDNATINRIWGQQLEFQNAVIALRKGFSSFAVKVLPWLQSLSRMIKRK